uniref:Uncharacterized protein n=1 Tax=Anguilla anguilla TaxID=7936 RepID=A0A0E9WQ58_ANGAN
MCSIYMFLFNRRGKTSALLLYAILIIIRITRLINELHSHLALLYFTPMVHCQQNVMNINFLQ